MNTSTPSWAIINSLEGEALEQNRRRNQESWTGAPNDAYLFLDWDWGRYTHTATIDGKEVTLRCGKPTDPADNSECMICQGYRFGRKMKETYHYAVKYRGVSTSKDTYGDKNTKLWVWRDNFLAEYIKVRGTVDPPSTNRPICAFCNGTVLVKEAGMECWRCKCTLACCWECKSIYDFGCISCIEQKPHQTSTLAQSIQVPDVDALPRVVWKTRTEETAPPQTDQMPSWARINSLEGKALEDKIQENKERRLVSPATSAPWPSSLDWERYTHTATIDGKEMTVRCGDNSVNPTDVSECMVCQGYKYGRTMEESYRAQIGSPTDPRGYKYIQRLRWQGKA